MVKNIKSWVKNAASVQCLGYEYGEKKINNHKNKKKISKKMRTNEKKENLKTFFLKKQYTIKRDSLSTKNAPTIEAMIFVMSFSCR